MLMHKALWPRKQRRSLGHVGKFAPCGEPGRKVFAIERSAQQMWFQCEVLTDRTEARQESLGALRVAKASHAPLAVPRGLMAVLCTVVDTGRGLEEHVLHVETAPGFRLLLPDSCAIDR